MSSNSTDTGSTSQSSDAAAIHSSLNSVMMAHTFLTLLIPLVIALFYFSTPQSRQRPLFILNLVAIFLAFLDGVLIDAFGIHSVLEPLNPWPLAFNIVVGFVAVWQSIVVDFTLLVRLISVYPPSHVGRIGFALLITIPVGLKLTRAINIITFTKVMVDAMNGPNPSVLMAEVFITRPYLKIEWAAQMIDNTYASLAFLWKMYQHGNNRVVTNSSRVTFVERLQTLFRIAVANFVIPTMFSIAQFVCDYRNVSAIIVNQLVVVNTMVATFCVVFATVWAGNVSKEEAEALEAKRTRTSSRLMPIFKFGSGRNLSSTVMVSGTGYMMHSRDDLKESTVG